MLEKFEGYIKRKKRNINPKILSVGVFFLFGVILVCFMNLGLMYKKNRELLEDEYNRSMYEMVGYVKNVNIQLSKLKVSNGKKVITTTLADIWRQSNLAKENLANLPVNQENMGNTSKYLTQLSDFSYFLVEKVSSGKDISDDEYKNINELSEYSKKLFAVTSKIYDDVNSGKLKWDEVEKVASHELSEDGDINVYSISKTFQDYAGLIYDGAFSEHILDVKPQMLTGKVISKEEAEAKLKEIYKEEEIEYISYVGEVLNKIQLYNFKIKLKGEETEKSIYLTKDTGLIYLIISDKIVSERKITDKRAEEIGLEYLKRLGISDMEDTYYYIQDNMITINYAATQNGILMYPDLIKVKIALDTGEVCSLEAGGYIYNHKERSFLGNYISQDDAKAHISDKMEILSVREAVIPTDAKEEIYTYEFECKMDDKNYLVYINAENGEEEKILIMIETVNGTLSM